MTQKDNQLFKGNQLKAMTGPNSFASLLRQEGDDIRRDVFMILHPEDSVSGKIESGITLLYPGCKTKGHSHSDREEVYFFLSGKGIMGVDGQEYEVQAGDTYYVKPGPFHTTKNPYDMPFEFFWITIKIE
jgi:mannose-6-phosphate isomerase-like protein (cupin superfamily)